MKIEEIEARFDAAKQRLAGGFFDGDELRTELRAELPLELAYTLERFGVAAHQVEALALAIRDVADVAAEPPLEAPSVEQRAMIDGILGERALPEPLGEILGAAKLETRRDVQALYGLLYGTFERFLAFGDLERLAAEPEV